MGETDDLIWKGLANPVRRQILDELRGGPLTTGDLAARFDDSRHVVMQHLQVLRDADLVHVERRGRERWNHLNPVPIQRIHERWVSKYESPWAQALLGIKDAVEGAAAPHHAETTDLGRTEGRNHG